ncbi:MAG: trypsin-like peptidase domain-containing protein [Cyanobacteria bacterium J06635_1]
MWNPFKKAATYGVLLLAGMAVGGPIAQRFSRGPTVQRVQARSVAQAPTSTPVSPSGPPPNFIAAAADRTGPAVVRIDSNRSGNLDRQGTGSGFIIDDNGTILTNAHVVEGVDAVSVTLSDGRSFTGEVIGQDELTDVAVVKVEASNLPTVTIGDSASLRPGEWAIAIGNPLGLDNTVTAGIISGTGRSSGVIGSPNQRVRFIQTDAAINPGNSGGPLLNQAGEVIGINTAIIGRAQGLGFAIPIDRAQVIADQLVTNGSVQHPYLGVRMANLTPRLRESLAQEENLTIQADAGVVIVEVQAESPAASGGLQVGDIIRAVGDQQVETADQVQSAVEASTIGERLSILVERDGEDVSVAVNPGEFQS